MRAGHNTMPSCFFATTSTTSGAQALPQNIAYKFLLPSSQAHTPHKPNTLQTENSHSQCSTNESSISVAPLPSSLPAISSESEAMQFLQCCTRQSYTCCCSCFQFRKKKNCSKVCLPQISLVQNTFSGEHMKNIQNEVFC